MNRTVNTTAFRFLKSLTELRMYGTTTANLRPDTYPDEALSFLPNLENLWIDGMTNRSFRQELQMLKKLHTLRFPGNLVGFGFCNILNMTGTFDNVPSLTHLYVIKCGLQFIDKHAFRHLTYLQYLDLSENKLLTISGISKALFDLQYTNVSILVLNQLKATLFQDCGVLLHREDLEGLKNTTVAELHLERNGISKVKDTSLFKNLPSSLKKINLRENTLTMDLYIFYVYLMKNLTDLDVSYQFFHELWNSKGKQDQYHDTSPIDRDVWNSQQITGGKELFDEVSAYPPASGTLPTSSSASPSTVAVNRKQTECPMPLTPIPPIVPFLPENLENIDLSHSKLNLPIYNLTVKNNTSLRRILAADAQLFCWLGPVKGLLALEYLDLSNNRCKRVSQNFFDEFTELKELDISNNGLGEDIRYDQAGMIMKNMNKLQRLNLSMNSINVIPNAFLCAQSELQVLDLSSNILTSFELRMDHMKKLNNINLSYNGITSLNNDVRITIENLARTTPLILNLLHNRLHCYCRHIETLKWIRKANSSSLNIAIDRCFDDSDTLVPINNPHDLDAIISRLERECVTRYEVIISVTVAALIVTNVIVGVLVYRYRWKLRYWYYVSRHYYRRKRGKYRRLDSPANGEDNMKYDVFVICSVEDARSKFVQDMFQYLQNKHGLNLVEQHRHFFANQFIAQMISSAINQSRVSVFVVTTEWLLEGKWEFPMQMCLEESMSRGRRMYFSVFPEDLPEDVQNNRMWRDLYNVSNANENLEYPGGQQTENDPDILHTFWQQCYTKIADMMGRT